MLNIAGAAVFHGWHQMKCRLIGRFLTQGAQPVVQETLLWSAPHDKISCRGNSWLVVLFKESAGQINPVWFIALIQLHLEFR